MFYLARLEETLLSTWIRETGWVFFSSLILHALGLALVVGVSLVILLRELGFAAAIPAGRLRDLRPLSRGGLVGVLCSGGLLLLAYPAKALSNPVFYLKIAALCGALSITRGLLEARAHSPALAARHEDQRGLAALGVILWIASVTAGRFLAYTHNVLLASSFY